jgi:hypothetical protein
MNVLKVLGDWYRGARERERIANPLRVRVLVRELWPWYLPHWILPVILVSEMFLGMLPRDKLVIRALLPFIATLLIFAVPTRKMEMSGREIIFFYNFVPLCSFMGSAIVWIYIHDHHFK